MRKGEENPRGSGELGAKEVLKGGHKKMHNIKAPDRVSIRKGKLAIMSETTLFTCGDWT